MLTGDPGTGKSIALRLLAERLRALPDVLVGSVEQSAELRTMDFYRELGDLFGAPARRSQPVGRPSRPCALAGPITSPPVDAGPYSSSTRPRKPSLLTVLSGATHPRQQVTSTASSSSASLFAGDARLPERLQRGLSFLPPSVRASGAGSLSTTPSRDELLACLDHLLAAAGNPSLMTSELRVTLAEHAAGNYRVLMTFADELLAVAADRGASLGSTKSSFLEVFAQTPQSQAPAAAAQEPR